MSIRTLNLSWPPRARRAVRSRAWRLPVAVGGMLLALLLAGCSGVGIDPLVALSVNGHAVSLAAFQRIVEIQKVGASSQGQTTSWQSPEGRVNLSSAQVSAYGVLDDVVLIHEQAQKQRLVASNATVLKEVNSLFSSLSSQLAQSPSDAGLITLTNAAKQAVKTEKADKPTLEALLQGSPSLSDAIIIYAYENADVHALFAKGTVPSAHVRLIELGSQKAADSLQQQLVAHKVDFATYAKQHSLDTSTAPNGGELGTFRVGELSQQSTALDTVIFGPKADYTKATTYVVMPISGGKALVVEITKRANVALSTITDAQTQNNVFGGWLQIVAKPAAQIEQYVAVDPTPASASTAP